MQQSSLVAFAAVGKQAEKTSEQRPARQHARKERKKEALALLGLPWPEPIRKGASRPTLKDQYQAASSQVWCSLPQPALQRNACRMAAWTTLGARRPCKISLRRLQSSAASAQVKDKERFHDQYPTGTAPLFFRVNLQVPLPLPCFSELINKYSCRPLPHKN